MAATAGHNAVRTALRCLRHIAQYNQPGCCTSGRYDGKGQTPKSKSNRKARVSHIDPKRFEKICRINLSIIHSQR